MKLKTIVRSMAVLGLVGTSAFAAPHVQVAHHSAVAAKHDSFWQSVTYRNQDNAGLQNLTVGQTKVTGEVAAKLTHADKGGKTNKTAEGSTDVLTGYNSNSATTNLDLSTANLYIDSRVNDFASVHVALDLTGNAQASEVSDNNGNPEITNGNKTNYLSEAYASLNHGHYYANIGHQYLNFGSAAHNTISTPVVETLTAIDVDAVSFGAVDFGGVYADASLFKGVPAGNSTANNNGGDDDFNNSSNGMAGYTFELGYAMDQGANDYYGFNGVNVYVDYLDDMQNLASIQAILSSQPTSGKNTKHFLAKKAPMLAAHIGYATGPFQVAANYAQVMNDLTNEGADAVTPDTKFGAYNLEADYSFGMQHVQTVSFDYEGTQYLSGFQLSSSAAFDTPETRMGLGYAYHLSKAAAVEVEYMNDKDYSKDATPRAGSGESVSTILAEFKVAF